MPKTKTREISILAEKSKFSLFKNPKDKSKYDFADISALRHLLSNEKAKLLYIIKKTNPESIYDLAKKSKRTFKSVYEDVILLERFGFINLIKDTKNGRKVSKPVIDVSSIKIEIKI